ncbi:MAG: Gfo/Idh/MocA family oxidoreductase, partial [Bacillota bacterium]|nr:Gfo/Idh/MocA family oxidoreductase [Bacillota bacterium]
MKKLKTVIIGCGNICLAHGYPLAYENDVELVAVCDIKEERAMSIAKQLNCKYYTDYKKMLNDEEVDAVHVCTPHYVHHDMVIYACNLGKHVMTEKPMSITLADAEEMISVAKKNNVYLGVIFQNRFNSSSQLIKKTLVSGELGKIKSAKATVTWNRGDAYYNSSDWRGDLEKEGGGVVIDQAIHTLDLMRWLISDEIEFVQANISNKIHDKLKVEDSAEGIIKYRGGVISSFYAMNYYSCDAPIEIELHCENGIAKIIGSKGNVIFNDKRQYIADVDESEKEKFGPFNKDCWGISHIKQINDFYNTIRNGGEQYITA